MPLTWEYTNVSAEYDKNPEVDPNICWKITRFIIIYVKNGNERRFINDADYSNLSERKNYDTKIEFKWIRNIFSYKKFRRVVCNVSIRENFLSKSRNTKPERKQQSFNFNSFITKT